MRVLDHIHPPPLKVWLFVLAVNSLNYTQCNAVFEATECPIIDVALFADVRRGTKGLSTESFWCVSGILWTIALPGLNRNEGKPFITESGFWKELFDHQNIEAAKPNE